MGLGRVASDTDDRPHNVVDSGLLDALSQLLSHRKEQVRKETCCVISILHACDQKVVQRVFESCLVVALLEILRNGDESKSVKCEAITAIANAGSGSLHRPRQYIRGRCCREYLLGIGCFESLLGLLPAEDPTITLHVIRALTVLGRVGKQWEDIDDLRPHPSAVTFPRMAECLEPMLKDVPPEIRSEMEQLLELMRPKAETPDS